MRNEEIPSFVDLFWPLDSRASKLANFYLQNIDIDEQIVSEFERLNTPFEKFLTKKYGMKNMNQYNKLVEMAINGENSTDLYNKINSFVFRTGLCNDYPLDTVIRGKATLASILGILEEEDEPFSLIDCGSGEGKISAGIALYNKNVQKVYAVDYSHWALERMNQNLEALSEGDREIVQRKLVPIKADFTDSESLLSRPEFQKCDIALAAYPLINQIEVPAFTTDLIKHDGRTIMYFPKEGMATPPTNLQELNEIFHDNGFPEEMNIRDVARYAFNNYILATEHRLNY